MIDKIKGSSLDGSLNTLAQTETTYSGGMVYLYGKGSDIGNQKSIQRRARCKLINQKTMTKLANIAREKGAYDREKAYWNTYYCQNRIVSANGRLYGPQCKNRFCTYCSGIRKAALINKYLPVIKTWEEPFFVTLTIKAVKGHLLANRIKALNRGFRIIIAKYRKRYQRGKGPRLMGLKTPRRSARRSPTLR